MKKRLFALLTVLVLLFMASTALATKPTAKLDKASKNQTVKVGKVIEWSFVLNSGSYGKKNDAFRSKLGSVILYNSKQVGAASWVWSGKQRYNLKAKISKKMEAGKYTLQYTVYCRTKEAAAWKKVKTQTTKFTVKK